MIWINASRKTLPEHGSLGQLETYDRNATSSCLALARKEKKECSLDAMEYPKRKRSNEKGNP
jgi:hypothetical protein